MVAIAAVLVTGHHIFSPVCVHRDVEGKAVFGDDGVVYMVKETLNQSLRRVAGIATECIALTDELTYKR